jgi:hypothetical protein
MSNVQELHEKMSRMKLEELMLAAIQAIEIGMEEKRLDLILQYVETKIKIRRITRK